MTRKSIVARLIATLLMVGLSLPTVVWADTEKAADYYQQATDAYQNGDLELAADLLNKAYAEDPDLVYQYNRILALQGLGKYEEALQVAAALEAPMKADPQNRFEDIGQIKLQLESQVQKQREADAANQTNDPNGPNGTDTQLKDQTTIEPQPKGPPILAYGLIGGGVALAIPGLLFVTALLLPSDAAVCLGIRGPKDNSVRGDACEAFAIDKGKATEEGRDAADAGAKAAKDAQRTHGIFGVAFLAAGALTAAAGVVLLLLNGADGSAALSDQPRDTLTVAPWFSGDGAGAAIHFRF